MSQNVMRETGASVKKFIETVEHPRKKSEAFKLLKIFESVTSLPAKMWGPSIIGFGTYHYVYASGREGDSPLVAFSPRKANIVLYLDYEGDDRDQFLERLGKHKVSKGCIYVNKLADIDIDVLKELIQHTQSKYENLK